MKNSLKILLNSILPISSFVILTLAAASCENESFTSADTNQITTGDNIKMLTVSNDGEILPFTTNLMAGQHHVAGTVSVTSDGVNVFVTYSTNCGNDDNEEETEEESIISNVSKNSQGSWTLKATHLYVGNCEDLPTTNKGNPKIGKFPYKTEHGEGVNEFTYTIPLSDIGECFCLAAHAEVDCGECNDDDEDDNDNDDEDTITNNESKSSDSDDDDNYCGEETAWAEGNNFPGNSWAMYTEFCIETDNGDE